MTDLVKLPPATGLGPVLTRRPDLADEAAGYARGARAPATRKALAADWRIFTAWCRVNDAEASPATIDTVVAFLVEQARTKALATVMRYRASISTAHKLAGHPSPTRDPRVREVLAGLRNARGTRTVQKEAATFGLLDQFATEHAVDLRDRAVFLVGLWGALRRESIVALDLADLQWADAGVIALLRRSKTDQAGRGHEVALPRQDDHPEACPVRALRRWIDFAKIGEGAVFRTITKGGRVTPDRMPPGRVAKIVKRAALLAGLDPASFGGHSLRAGYVTEARKSGIDWTVIMEQTGHRKLATVKRYLRGPVDPFRATHVSEVFAAAFAARGRVPSDLPGVHIRRVGLPLPNPKTLDRFQGGSSHRKLCSAVGRWFSQQGMAWKPECDYPGGRADLGSEATQLYVEVGDVSVEKVLRALRADCRVMIVPYGLGDVVGFLLSGRPTGNDSKEALEVRLKDAAEKLAAAFGGKT